MLLQMDTCVVRILYWYADTGLYHHTITRGSFRALNAIFFGRTKLSLAINILKCVLMTM